ncbi:hypothetical protein KEM54_004569 [Ascosphaera aggregata]|nr:hypothetical protein KEM54_004569 [Ascosphaera aggregata]
MHYDAPDGPYNFNEGVFSNDIGFSFVDFANSYPLQDITESLLLPAQISCSHEDWDTYFRCDDDVQSSSQTPFNCEGLTGKFNQHLQPEMSEASALSDIGSPYTQVTSLNGGSVLSTPPQSSLASRETSICLLDPQVQNFEQALLPELPSESVSVQDSEGERRLTPLRKELYDVIAEVYYCPMGKPNGELCSKKHKPTTQKCKYVRNLDSHFLPFWCDECERPFSSKNVYSRHVREQHLARKSFCTYPGCTRTHGFSRERNMYDHMRRTHNIDTGSNSPKSSQGKVHKNRSCKAKKTQRKGFRSSGNPKV